VGARTCSSICSCSRSTIRRRIRARSTRTIPRTSRRRFAFASTSEKGYAQALIVGQEILFTTDSTDVNAGAYGTGGNTGHAYHFNLGTNSAGPTIVVGGGAGSVGERRREPLHRLASANATARHRRDERDERHERRLGAASEGHSHTMVANRMKRQSGFTMIES